MRPSHNILITEHYENFEKKLQPKLEYLYEKYNWQFSDYNLFGQFWIIYLLRIVCCPISLYFQIYIQNGRFQIY